MKIKFKNNKNGALHFIFKMTKQKALINYKINKQTLINGIYNNYECSIIMKNNVILLK